MRIFIITIGRLKSGPEKLLADRFIKQITWPLTVCEVEAKKKLKPQNLIRREGKLLVDACPNNAKIIAMDRSGQQFTSLEFADQIKKWQQDAKNIVFIIGGPYGLDKSVIESAELVLSFGQLTWPHMLARAMLLEQLYRVQQITKRHPYHKE